MRALAPAALLLATVAAAHPVTVDGQLGDWSTRTAFVSTSVKNLGLVARGDAGWGEYVWDDATGDTRTDVAAPEVLTDLVRLRVTGSDAGVFFAVQLAGTSFPGVSPPQVQVAIDLDRDAGSGNQNFLGFADTNVAQDARWEFLLQTQASGAGVRLWDASPAVLGVPGLQVARDVSAGGTTYELFVPWAALGLSGVPSRPLRLTVGAFRENGSGDTLDVGGPTISNALDVVADLGDPTLSPAPNTYAEVSDQTVNFNVDVWFDPHGEVYAPLLITHFVSDGTTANGGEYVALTNVSPHPYPLDGVRLSDAEKVKSGESIYFLTPGSVLAPGARYVVAANGAAYLAHFGRRADAEFNTGPTDEPGTPNLVLFTTWGATLAWTLANAGDELLLYDGRDQLLDVVTYGVGSPGGFPGVTARQPPPPQDHVLSRLFLTQDTDDCGADFVDRGTTCTTTLSCGAVGACITCSLLNACEPQPAGTACSDSNVCNGLELCDSFGACAAGTPLVCVDANPCTLDTCHAVQGCVFVARDAGSSCSDGNACNGLETCDSTPACVPGAPPVCDDGNVCTLDACDAGVGCLHQPTNLGASCSDGNVCNGSETCAPTGACTAPGPLACDDGNPCTTDACDADAGCTHALAASGTDCGDGDACNGLETCNAVGACVAGTPPSCNDGNVCTSDSCDSALGCQHAAITPGTSCSDGNACNGVETCSAAGACVVTSSPPSCADTNPCTVDSCSPSLGCQHAVADAGTRCDDGNLCNGIEACNGVGVCQAGTPLACGDGNSCTVDSCVPATGCAYAAVDAGVACSDGNLCNGAETCNGAGSCVAGSAPNCDDSNPCTLDGCAPGGGCTHAPLDAGVSCSDGNACNGAEVCGATGVCQAGTPLVCGDSNSCTVDTCAPAIGCVYAPLDAGVSCTDGNLCNGLELCNGAGSCVAGTPPSCDDGNTCTLDGCTAGTGCTHTPADAGTSCSDGNACNGVETCGAAGVCQAGTPLACSDNNPCTTDVCSPSSGCLSTPVTPGMACSDGDLCNGLEQCGAGGVCRAGTPLGCDDGNPCTADSCNAGSGCLHAPITSGSCADAGVVDAGLPDAGSVDAGAGGVGGAGGAAGAGGAGTGGAGGAGGAAGTGGAGGGGAAGEAGSGGTSSDDAGAGGGGGRPGAGYLPPSCGCGGGGGELAAVLLGLWASRRRRAPRAVPRRGRAAQSSGGVGTRSMPRSR